MILAAAAATPEPNSFLQFWVIIGFLASIFSNVIVAIVVLIGRKQKREVSFGFVPASKADFDQHVAENKAEHEQIRAALEKDRRDNEIHASQRQATLFKELKEVRMNLEKRINRISIGVARLCERVGAQMPREEDEI